MKQISQAGYIAIFTVFYAAMAAFCLGADWKQSIGIFCALMAVAPIIK